jgi:hypothetical protein
MLTLYFVALSSSSTPSEMRFVTRFSRSCSIFFVSVKSWIRIIVFTPPLKRLIWMRSLWELSPFCRARASGR